MTGTVTFVGLDVHARSTHAAAVDVMTGELTRVRFGEGLLAPITWLGSLPSPVWACYEAGPTGFGLYRAATEAGIRVDVIAPGKTPRGPADRVKSDRKDAELLARCLMAGSLTPVKVPSLQVEGARDLTRAHDRCRRDLMTARHRLSKMLLRYGLIYPKPTTWTQRHRRWLVSQQFPDPISELVYADLMAATDGLTSRKAALAERISLLALEKPYWPTVARLRCFRGVDTLTALSIHLELSADWARFQRASRLGCRLGLTPRSQVRGIRPPGLDHQDRLRPRPPLADRGRLAVRSPTSHRREAGQPAARPARSHPSDRQPSPVPGPSCLHTDALAGQAQQRDRRRLCP